MAKKPKLRQRKTADASQAPSKVRPHHKTERHKTEGQSFSCWKLCKLLFLMIIGFPFVLLSLFFLMAESPIDPLPINLPPPPEWTGPLVPNKDLASMEHLFLNQLLGPESLVLHHGHLYTGTADGKVLDIENDQVEVLTSFGSTVPPCKGDPVSEPRCGRPLGMRIDKDGHLIVIDAYLGIFKVNVTTGEHNLLLPSSVNIAGKEPKLLNDLDIATEGTIFFSDSSTKWQRKDYLWPLLEGRGNGRLVKFNLSSHTTQVLVDGLLFANGVQLSPEEDFVLVAETGMARILKYHLKGPKEGQSEVFADNLPGLPDNIRRCRSGGYWVPVGLCRRKGSFSMQDFFASKPMLRKHMAKLPSKILTSPLTPRCSLLLQLSEEGQIVRTLQDPDNLALSMSEVEEDDNGVLYTGSYDGPYIGKIKFSES